MSGNPRSIQEIKERCRRHEAVVLSEAELWERLQGGAAPQRPDIVVFAFGASMRGTSAMLLVPVAGKGVFTRAETITLGGVPAYPGPAPNERLGVVDAQLFADQSGESDGPEDMPAGTRVLIDMLGNRDIPVVCHSAEGDEYRNAFTLDGIEFARMVTYNTFLPARLNTAPDAQPPAHLGMIRVGSTIFLNRAPGIVIGAGTRNAPGKASLSLSADMFDMDPASIRKQGSEALHSVAIPVPIVNDAVFADVKKVLGAIPADRAMDMLPAADREAAAFVRDRILAGDAVLTGSTLPVNGFA
jgi:uncharacterized protein (DUF39 family)